MNKNLAQLAIVALLLLSIISAASARVLINDSDRTGIYNAVSKIYDKNPGCRIFGGLIEAVANGTISLDNMTAFKQENKLRYKGMETCFAGLTGKVDTADIGQKPVVAAMPEKRGEPAIVNYMDAESRNQRRQEVVARYYLNRTQSNERVAFRQGEVKGEFLSQEFNSIGKINDYYDGIVNGSGPYYAARPWIRYIAQDCQKWPKTALWEVAKTGTTSYMPHPTARRSLSEFTNCFKELVGAVLAATGKTEITITRGVTSGTPGEVMINVPVSTAGSGYPADCTKKYMTRWVDHCKNTGQCPTGMQALCGLS